MNWDSLRQTVVNFTAHWESLAYVILILLVTAVVALAIHLVLRKRCQRESTARHVWKDALLGALNAPLQGVVWMIGLSVAVDALTDGGRMSLLAEIFPPARDVAVIAIAAWFLIRVVGRVEGNLFARARRHEQEFDATAAGAIGKLARAVIVVAAALVMMQSLGFSIASLLAFGGVAGIAIGFAAQTLVANLLGGLTVYVSRIFKVGEDIILPGTEVAGTVQQIGWRATRVLGWNGKPFYVPNALFNTKTLVNHSRLERRSFSEYLLLRYRDFDKLQAIVRRANEVLAGREDLAYFVFRFDSFGDAALKLNLYAWPQSAPDGGFLPYAEFARIKEEVLLAIAAIAVDEGCDLIQPNTHVYVRQGGGAELGEPARGAEPGHVLPPRARPGTHKQDAGKLIERREKA
ncbi:MAG TPA: mechanosensitive ion channel domain-containing protein [Gammaproteobacteria bacterium]|nr:mechanosensitive ion channel domain-containing protein [Gammaproteobacteria bacterium]